MKNKADYLLLSYFAIWLVFGLIMLTSASGPVAYERFGDGYFYIKKQMLLGVLPGLVLFFIFAKIDYHRWRSFGLLFYLACLLLLVLVFIPGIGSTNNTGAHSWINLLGHSFQPAEFAKLCLIIFLSALLTKHGYAGLQDFKSGFLPVLGMGLLPIVLVILQPDVGTVAVLFTILFTMLFISGARWAHIFGLAGIGVAALMLMIIIAPYRLGRVTTFMHPELDPQGIGYQINQAFLAIGSGGFFGRGLGQSLQKFQYLPEVHADSIFAVIGEEMGLIFAIGLVVLIILAIGRSLILAKNAPDQFGRLLVTGIITWFGIQSVLNIGAMVGVLPLTGLPLPFVSHGGTALMISLAGVGIITNVSKHV